MKFPLPACLLFVTAVFLTGPSTATAQVRASEFATISQVIDGTTMTVEYSRPRVRGRDTIFGGPVYWGEVWTPGANWATTLEIDKDVEIDSYELTAGKYSLWLVVQPEGWTVVLDPNHRLFHTVRPEENARQIRYPIQPQEGPFTEALTFTFTELSPRGATLAMNWQNTYVPLEIKVRSSRELTVAADVAEKYVGSYAMSWSDELAREFETQKDINFEIVYENASLVGRMDPPPFPDWSDLMLLTLAEDWFTPAALQNGEIFDVVSDLVFEFGMTDGMITGFEIRAGGDDLLATATKNQQ